MLDNTHSTSEKPVTVNKWFFLAETAPSFTGGICPQQTSTYVTYMHSASSHARSSVLRNSFRLILSLWRLTTAREAHRVLLLWNYEIIFTYLQMDAMNLFTGHGGVC